MRKFISMLIASAMIASMSVTAFAANRQDVSFGPSETEVDSETPSKNLSFSNTMIIWNDGQKKEVETENTNFKHFKPGDVLYFEIMNKDGSSYTGPVDKDWSINISGNGFVKDADFSLGHKAKGSIAEDGKTKYVKVTIVNDFDNLEADEVEFNMYVADNQHKGHSGSVTVHYPINNKNKVIDFEFINNVGNEPSIWEVKGDKKGTAIFSFSNDASFVVEMLPDEKVVFNYSNEDLFGLMKQYDYEYDMAFYNFKGENDSFYKEGTLFIESKKNDKFVYEIVDGEIKKAEAEYTENYKKINSISTKGYVVSTDELGFYVVTDKEILEVNENKNPVKPEVKPNVPDKKNPEMGGIGFVPEAIMSAFASIVGLGALVKRK